MSEQPKAAEPPAQSPEQSPAERGPGPDRADGQGPGAGPAQPGAGTAAGEPGEEGQAREASPWNDPRLPWEGKPRRADIACWAAITLSGLFYLAILPWRASLVGTHPVISELLNGSTEAIVSAAAFARVGHGSLVIVLLASIPGQMKFDIIYWWAGRLWGERIIGLFAGRSKRQQRRGLKFIARVNRWGRWFTWPAVVVSPFLPVPNAIIYAVAGWTGMRWLTFLVLDAIGSLAWAGLLAGLGWELGHSAVSVAETVSKYGLWVSLAIVLVVVAGQMRGARLQR